MLEGCDALLIAKSPRDIAFLRRLSERVGYRSATAPGEINPKAGTTAINFFLLHFGVPDDEKRAILAAVRRSADDQVRFAPVVIVIDDCPFETILQYVHWGFDDVVVLPEKVPLVRARLEGQLANHHTYFETPGYFGPDRRRMDDEHRKDERRREYGSRHTRLTFARDTRFGVRIISRTIAA